MSTTSDRPAFLGPDLSPDENAPYGYTVDATTGEIRPKLKAGRPAKSAAPRVQPAQVPPSLADLKQAAEITGGAPREPDRVPGSIGSGSPRGRGRRGRGQSKSPPGPKPEPDPLPPFRAGPIASGMNKLYRKAGRLIRLVDDEIGLAVIACTRKGKDEDGRPIEDDVTVGEAWEELARTNPRIRGLLLTLLSGGALMQLVMAHAPILVAILMKRGIQRLIPWHKVATALLADEPEQQAGQEQDGPIPGAAGPAVPPGLGTMMAAMTEEDWAQVNSMMGAMMGGAAARVAGAPARAPVVDGPDVPDDPGGGP